VTTTSKIAGPSLFTVWNNVISRVVCAKAIAAMNGVTRVPGAVLREGADHVDFAMRRCEEHPVADDQAKPIAGAIQVVASQALSLQKLGRARFDGPKFCSYAPGGYFRAHRDRSLDLADPMPVRTRVLSLVCLLNDANSDGSVQAFDGGALVLYLPRPDGTFAPANVPLSAGSVVAFSSDLLHEVRPVRRGVRFSAVAWLYNLDPSQEKPDAQSSFRDQ
jgi:predicted 2-oxoglutarate/Fe(II)-dependent dioxygenase YbiX